MNWPCKYLATRRLTNFIMRNTLLVPHRPPPTVNYVTITDYYESSLEILGDLCRQTPRYGEKFRWLRHSLFSWGTSRDGAQNISSSAESSDSFHTKRNWSVVATTVFRQRIVYLCRHKTQPNPLSLATCAFRGHLSGHVHDFFLVCVSDKLSKWLLRRCLASGRSFTRPYWFYCRW